MLRNRKISDWILKERLLACVLEREKSERPVSYPGPRGFLLFFVGKFCDANRFLNFFIGKKRQEASRRKFLNKKR